MPFPSWMTQADGRNTILDVSRIVALIGASSIPFRAAVIGRASPRRVPGAGRFSAPFAAPIVYRRHERYASGRKLFSGRRLFRPGVRRPIWSARASRRQITADGVYTRTPTQWAILQSRRPTGRRISVKEVSSPPDAEMKTENRISSRLKETSSNGSATPGNARQRVNK